MSNPHHFWTVRKNIFKKVTGYGQKLSQLGHRVRKLVFGFRQKSTLPSDRWSLPIKILHDHRLIQRRRAFEKSGGSRSSVALHALKKAQQKNRS